MAHMQKRQKENNTIQEDLENQLEEGKNKTNVQKQKREKIEKQLHSMKKIL